MRILFQPMILSAGAAAALVLAPLVAVDATRAIAPLSLPSAAQAQTEAPAEQTRQITVTGTGGRISSSLGSRRSVRWSACPRQARTVRDHR